MSMSKFDETACKRIHDARRIFQMALDSIWCAATNDASLRQEVMSAARSAASLEMHVP